MYNKINLKYLCQIKYSNHTLPFSDSPYGDVSGLPDPFHDPNMGVDVGNGVHHPLQHLSFDESQTQHVSETGNGYSTPSNRNRRIIREIIV